MEEGKTPACRGRRAIEEDILRAAAMAAGTALVQEGTSPELQVPWGDTASALHGRPLAEDTALWEEEEKVDMPPASAAADRGR